MDSIDLARDRDQWMALANTVMSFRDPENCGTFLSNCTIGGFAERVQIGSNP
jgi:hypothetical protein